MRNDFMTTMFMETLNEIQTKFILTDGSEWTLRELKNYTDSLDEEMAKSILKHFIIVEWNRYLNKTEQ